MKPSLPFRLGAWMLVPVLLSAAALTACGADTRATTVSVLGPWVDDPRNSGDESDAFQAALRQFGLDHQVTVDYQGTRDVAQALRSVIDEGRPPDIVVSSSAGDLAANADSLRSLTGIVDEQGASESQVLRNADKQAYAVAVKTTLKSIVWYDPNKQPELRDAPPATWDQLLAVSQAKARVGVTPWCLGVGATSSPGWPGTDWIEDILLHRSGPETYSQWASGDLPWDSPQVRDAWAAWGQLATAPGMVFGGRAGALLTDFADAGRPMVANPGCLFHHQGSFMATDYSRYGKDGHALSPGKDFGYFPFPPTETGSFEVSNDFAVLLTDKPKAGELLRYLRSDAGHTVWVAASKGAVMLADIHVERTYNQVTDDLARTLAKARSLCLDASDAMPPQMAAAFAQAVLEYLNAPDRIPALLDQLEQLRRLLRGPGWAPLVCDNSWKDPA